MVNLMANLTVSLTAGFVGSRQSRAGEQASNLSLAIVLGGIAMERVGSMGSGRALPILALEPRHCQARSLTSAPMRLETLAGRKYDRVGTPVQPIMAS